MHPAKVCGPFQTPVVLADIRAPSAPVNYQPQQIGAVQRAAIEAFADRLCLASEVSRLDRPL